MRKGVPPFLCLSRPCCFLSIEPLTRAGVQAKNILVAVGGKATKAPIEGAEHAIVSDEVLQLSQRPNK